MLKANLLCLKKYLVKFININFRIHKIKFNNLNPDYLLYPYNYYKIFI